MADELFLSPLDQVHRAAGAQFTEFGGWKLPLRFTSELAEHHAVRQTAGLFDLSHMAQFEVSGPAAGSGLDYALLGKHSDMPLGRASYSMLLSEDAGVIDDLIVYRLGPEEFFVISNASNRAVVAEGLGRRLEQIDPATHFQDVTRDRALIAVQGPASPAIMAAAGFPQASELGYYRAAKAEWRGYPVVLARTGYTGETGFEVSIAGQAGPELWEALVEAGRPHGLTLAGLAARDTLRLEAGMPLYGHELDLQTTPIEGGQGGFVRSKEADFVGKRALGERPVTKHLVGLRGSGRRAARAEYPVWIDGEQRGRVTSGALSPTLGYPVALAAIDGEQPAPGSRVEVDVRGQLAPYEVVDLPFYKAKEKK